MRSGISASTFEMGAWRGVGKMQLIEKPCSAELLKDLASVKGSEIGTGDSSPDMEKKAGVTERNLRLAVAVPEGFDPPKPGHVFIFSTGKVDKIATPSMAEGVMKSHKSEGLADIRRPSHPDLFLSW
jgi:hypothetical protein